MSLISSDSQALRPLPESQDWLISKGQDLGYFANDPEGICFGYAHMAKQAMLAGEFELFCDRLQLIHETPSEDLLANSELAANIKSENVRLAKLEIVKEYSKGEFDDFYKWLETLKQNKTEDEKAKIAEQVYGEVQKKVEEMMISQFSEEERYDMQLFLDVKPFFDSLEVYMHAVLHPDLFVQPPVDQSDVAPTPLVVPISLQDGIVNADVFSGIYQKNDIANTFRAFRESLMSVGHIPISLILNSLGDRHAITLSFDGEKWVYSDSNHSPAEVLFSDEEVAKKTMDSLFCEEKVVFFTKLYVREEHTHEAAMLTKEWHGRKEWQDVHKVTPEKAQLIDDNKSSWLFAALKINDVTTVATLLENGANVHQSDKNGDFPICMATELGHEEALKLLLEKKAYINQQDFKYGNTALYFAIQNGHENIVKYLLDKGANIFLQNALGDTALHIAIRFNRDTIFTLLLDKNPKIDRQNKEGSTPLHLAVLYGNMNAVRLLLEKGANVNQSDKNGDTALHYAVKSGRNDIVEMLLEKNANVSQVTRDGLTPFHFAMLFGQTDNLDTLLHRDASLVKPFHIHAQFLINGANAECQPLLKILIKEKHNGSVPKQLSNFSPLELAVFGGRIEVINSLLSRADYSHHLHSAIAYAKAIMRDDIVLHLEKVREENLKNPPHIHHSSAAIFFHPRIEDTHSKTEVSLSKEKEDADQKEGPSNLSSP